MNTEVGQVPEISRKGKKTSDENDNTTTSSNTEMAPVNCSEIKKEVGIKNEKLEVPSEELQCIQKQVLIEKLMERKVPIKEEEMEVAQDDSDPKRHSDLETNQNQPKRHRGSPPKGKNQMPPPRKTFKMKSSVLDRVKSFLPELKTANIDLLKLPDPSKLSIESDSDRDEMDGYLPIPGTSGSKASKDSKDPKDEDNRTFVEMNLALYEESGSDTSSEDEGDNVPPKGKSIKGLPEINRKIKVSDKAANIEVLQPKEESQSSKCHPNPVSSEGVNKVKVNDLDQLQSQDAIQIFQGKEEGVGAEGSAAQS